MLRYKRARFRIRRILRRQARKPRSSELHAPIVQSRLARLSEPWPHAPFSTLGEETVKSRKFKRKTLPEKCPDCNRAYKDCICRFYTILDVPEFLRRRAVAVGENREDQVTVIQKTVFLLNQIMDNIPPFYVTRGGCEAEDRPMQAHSKHDAVRIMGALMITEFNEIAVNLYSGAHDSARRNMRSMLEWMARVVAAVSDRSIFTGKPQDANKAACFLELREAIARTNAKRQRAEPRQNSAELPQGANYEKSAPSLDFLDAVYVPDGIGAIPSKLNARIVSNFQPHSRAPAGGSSLLYYYNKLSQSIHNSIHRIDDIPYGGLTAFFDLESFDESYFLIYGATDMILCFYFILMDIDVFHGEAADRKKYREYAEKTFARIFGHQAFPSCLALFRSKVWNDPSMKFTHPSTG